MFDRAERERDRRPDRQRRPPRAARTRPSEIRNRSMRARNAHGLQRRLTQRHQAASRAAYAFISTSAPGGSVLIEVSNVNSFHNRAELRIVGQHARGPGSPAGTRRPCRRARSAGGFPGSPPFAPSERARSPTTTTTRARAATTATAASGAHQRRPADQRADVEAPRSQSFPIALSRSATSRALGRRAGVFSRHAATSASSAGRHVAPDRTDRRRRLREDAGDRDDRRIARERPPAGEHLVQHGAERKDVRAIADRPPLRLFRRHVRDRADDDTELGRGRGRHRRRDRLSRGASGFARPKSSILA